MRVLDGLRNPEHTGENRCLPCTVVNGCLLLVAAAVLAVAAGPGVAIAVGAAGSVLVWQRGYVVPYTPRFAPRLVDRLPIPDRWFAKRSGGGSIADEEGMDGEGGEDVLASLVAAGVVGLEGEDVVLDESFEARWRDEMSALAARSLADVAAAAESVPSVQTAEPVESEGHQWFVVDERHSLVAYPILVAELAAVRTLPDSVGTESVRLSAARVLRQFLDRCPVCDVELVPSSTAPCCGAPRDPSETRVCPACEHRLVTIPEPESEE